MAKAEWSREAEDDLEAIYRYIAFEDHRVQVAKKVIRRIRDHGEQQAESFSSGNVLGTSEPELGEEYRSTTCQRWVIVFRPLENTIRVVAVVDGSRNYSKLFK